MALTEAQKRAKAKWRKENEAQLNISLYRTSDGDVMDRLEAVSQAGCEGKKAYVLRLIREDISRDKTEEI